MFTVCRFDHGLIGFMLDASEEVPYIVFDISKFFLQRFGEFGDGVGSFKEHVDQVFPEHNEMSKYRIGYGSCQNIIINSQGCE